MSTPQALTGSIAASHVIKWLRAWYSTGMPDAIDLEIVRQMLPSTPYGTGVREIKAPMVLGHEVSGTIERLGEGGDGALAVGQPGQDGPAGRIGQGGEGQAEGVGSRHVMNQLVN